MSPRKGQSLPPHRLRQARIRVRPPVPRRLEVAAPRVGGTRWPAGAGARPPGRLGGPASEAARQDSFPAAEDTLVPPLDPAAPEPKSHGLLAYVISRDRAGGLHLAAAWPLWALLVPFPLWWALGLGSFIFPLMAIPMGVQLFRRRPVSYPPGWGLWALFLVWTLLSLFMYFSSPSGSHAGSLPGRALSTTVQLSDYASASVAMLFVGNLSRRELPVHVLVRWLGVLFLVTVAGGLLGTFMPGFGFTSPVEALLPGTLTSDPYISALVHPNAAQIQAVLGTGASGRAAAPFGYTNIWANNLSLLLVWFVCDWGLSRKLGRRLACGFIVAVAMLPVVYSLNRGLWIGLGVSVFWVSGRLFLHEKVGALLAVLAAVMLAVVVFSATPLHSQFNERLAHPESNGIRSYLTTSAIQGARESPIVGWGGTRKTIGSNHSIAIGKSPKCAQCGDFAIGSNGQLWTVVFNQGFVGAAFYLGFFAASVWLYRRDLTAVGQAGVLVVALTFAYMSVYVALPSSLTITMISIGILWRSRSEKVPGQVPATAMPIRLGR